VAVGQRVGLGLTRGCQGPDPILVLCGDAFPPSSVLGWPWPRWWDTCGSQGSGVVLLELILLLGESLSGLGSAVGAAGHSGERRDACDTVRSEHFSPPSYKKWEMSKATGRAFLSVEIGDWGQCCLGQGTWCHRAWRRWRR